MESEVRALSANVRRLRESHGLSLAALARRTGVAKATLFKIEARRTNPTLETLLERIKEGKPYYDEVDRLVGIFGTNEDLPNHPGGIFHPPPKPRCY